MLMRRDPTWRVGFHARTLFISTGGLSPPRSMIKEIYLEKKDSKHFRLDPFHSWHERLDQDE